MLTMYRIIALHVLLLGCYSLICTNLFFVLVNYGWDRDNTTKAAFIVSIIMTSLGAIVHIFVSPIMAVKK